MNTTLQARHAMPAAVPTIRPAAALAGAHVVRPSSFRHRVTGAAGSRFQPAAGRYHLYINYACPWAHRTLIVRALKGLERCIGITATHHRLDPRTGWTFAPERPEPHHGAQHLAELYTMAEPGFSGRVTVPVLWDTQHRTIVNNESSEIMRMLGSVFDRFADHPEVDLYPQAFRPAIDGWSAFIQSAVNEAVYGAGFATTQGAYEDAVGRLFDSLDAIEQHLATQRYLVGTQPTEADWRLFPTLLRFDRVYHGLFKCSRKRLVDYPQLWAYARELYQWPGIAATVNLHQVRDGYWSSMGWLNPNGIVPVEPAADFMLPHARGTVKIDRPPASLQR
jgi:glutathionyl-hydroquinone reductase